MMKENTYFVTINMKVPQGMMEVGRFFIGSDKDWAMESFGRLRGESHTSEDDVLRLDLLEKHEGTDLLLGQLSCTLDQLEQNCKLITVDAFKYFNLEG
ncbi:hypothetical protein [Dyadobacter bucti]|uniref:hypothetical protein n=1 Tax=Dyadobacter bucti TaxID=2572203 RepID=UPI003F72A730